MRPKTYITIVVKLFGTWGITKTNNVRTSKFDQPTNRNIAQKVLQLVCIYRRLELQT